MLQQNKQVFKKQSFKFPLMVFSDRPRKIAEAVKATSNIQLVRMKINKARAMF